MKKLILAPLAAALVLAGCASAVPELPAAIARESASCGQPCAACHARCGAQMMSATAPPASWSARSTCCGAGCGSARCARC